MSNLSKHFLIAIWLLAVGSLLLSCSDQGVQLEKQKVQFTLSPISTSGESLTDIDLPENTRAMISVTSSNGESVFTDHEISVFKRGDSYITDPLDLMPGGYVVTDFMIVKDSVSLYLTPKKDAEVTTSATDALPYNFSVAENNATVSMRVIDVQDEDIEKFGYASARVKANTLSIAAYEKKGDNTSLTSATAELRQNKKLLKTFSLASAVNTIKLEGDPKIPYTLTVYTGNSAKSQTFDIKTLKKEIGKNPLQIVLEPALVLSLESYVGEGNEYEEYFEFRMDGQGSVNVDWGDGEQSAITLPFQVSHEYFSGNYTAIITGDIHHVTDFSGFSYSTIISAISGLTNLPALKVYDPSWGAVPIKVDLSNCKQLERINVAKLGAPYEPCDLRTEFKLPTEHLINAFIFDAPSFDINREFISEEELDVMVNNIYNNAIARNIHDGKFFINPVVAPWPETQQKLDALESQYNWRVGFNEEIYEAYEDDSSVAGRSRTTSDPDTQREQWLRERFSNSEQIIKRAHEVVALN
jgi:hypothetical protein